jgi:hypothetical protein
MNQANSDKLAESSQVLNGFERVRLLLTPRENWTTGANARDKLSRVVQFNDPAACKFCLVGGLQRVATTSEYPRDVKLYNKMHFVLEGEIIPKRGNSLSLINFNDNADHEDILDLLDSVITKLKGKQQ